MKRDYNNTKIDAVVGHQACHFDSKMEYAYAQHLQHLLENCHIEDWEHHPKPYRFDGRSFWPYDYKPDFAVTVRGKVELHECKGKLEQADVRRFELMQKHHRKVDIVLVMLKRNTQPGVHKYIREIIYFNPQKYNTDGDAVYEPEHGRRR